MASPLDAETVAVLEPPSNVPLLSVRVTVEVSLVTTLPYASLTVIVRLNGVPALMLTA